MHAQLCEMDNNCIVFSLWTRRFLFGVECVDKHISIFAIVFCACDDCWREKLCPLQVSVDLTTKMQTLVTATLSNVLRYRFMELLGLEQTLRKEQTNERRSATQEWDCWSVPLVFSLSAFSRGFLAPLRANYVTSFACQ